MDCPVCKNEMEYDEPVHANFTSVRAERGQQTGDVYKCHTCNETYLDDFLSEDLHIFIYD